jgi:hypothetical protein
MIRICIFIILSSQIANAQSLLTPFEKTLGKNTTTYAECIAFYKKLALKTKAITIKELGVTDAGLSLHLVIYSANNNNDPKVWQKNKQPVFFINNGIHPGEPDGIDASMLFIRDIVEGKIKTAKNMVIALIPIYNIGGALQRNSTTRVNQKGPVAYGFRGNSQNLDLNRDFIKADSREALLFAKAFHYVKPDVFLDTHVSDGADYQHTLTLLTTHHSRLLENTARFLHDTLEPAIYNLMKLDKNPIIPYVNFEDSNPEKGWAAFYDAPRYSTGYTALFNCIGFMSETHMLKPYDERVKSTYQLINKLTILISQYKQNIAIAKTNDNFILQTKNHLPIKYKIDSTKKDFFAFNGYKAEEKISGVTGKFRMFYNQDKPFTVVVPLYNYLTITDSFTIPKAYIIPQGWHQVIERLQASNVKMQTLQNDTILNTHYYTISQYKSTITPYEKHHRNTQTQLEKKGVEKINFRKGDYIIYTNQPAKKFLHAVLSPQGEDSYFTWNFFDAILQQKEGYSNYRWEDIAAQILMDKPEIKAALELKKSTDEKFANSVDAQLDFVYKNSIWYEPNHNRYPIYFLD